MDQTVLTPEEYAAQIAASLSSGQDAPGMSPGSAAGLTPGVPGVAHPDLVAAAQAYAPPGSLASPPPIPAVAGATPGPPIVSGVAPTESPATVPGAERWSAPVVPPAGGQGVSMPPVPGGVAPLGMFASTEANVGRQQAATQAVMNAEADKARVASDSLLAQAKDRQDRQNADTAALSKINAESDRLRQDILDQKIDPNRLWNSKSDGQKAASLIGIILGGIGSGMAGGPNVALQVIDRQIERDINAQTAELGKKQNALSFMMQKYNNLEHAQQALRINQAEIYKMNLDAGLAKMDDPILRQKGALLSAQAGQTLANMKDTFAQQIGMMNYQMQMVGGMGGGAQGYGFGSGKNAAVPKKIGVDGVLEARAEDKVKTYYLPDGTPMLAVDQARAKDAADQMGALKAAQELLGRLASGKYGPIQSSEATDAARLELARVLGKGQISEGVLKDADNIIGGWKSRVTRGEDTFTVARDVLHDRIQAVMTTASGVSMPQIREKGR